MILQKFNTSSHRPKKSRSHFFELLALSQYPRFMETASSMHGYLPIAHDAWGLPILLLEIWPPIHVNMHREQHHVVVVWSQANYMQILNCGCSSTVYWGSVELDCRRDPILMKNETKQQTQLQEVWRNFARFGLTMACWGQPWRVLVVLSLSIRPAFHLVQLQSLQSP